MATFLGIDLAWGLTARTGLAVLDDTGALVASGVARSDDDIAAFLGPWTGADVVAAIDAPLVVRNAMGSRVCERELGALYRPYDAGAHPSNLSRSHFSPLPRGARLCERFGWDLDPGVVPLRGVPTAIEVYPHPAMVGLFELGRVLPYKAKRGRDLESLRSAFLLLLAHLERVTGPTLRLKESARWAHLSDSVAAAARKSELRLVEDELDAILCAYLALLWARDRAGMRVFGDRDGGYIVVPDRRLAPPFRRAAAVESPG